MVVLTLAGIGRGLAAASGMTVTDFGIPGVAFHICHTGDSDGDGPAPVDPSHHDCCDACALLAPVTLADEPSVSGPASVMHYVEHAHAMAWVPTIARLRTPRQSQGPPTA